MLGVDRITVIIPAYRVEQHIKTCLDTVLQQTYQETKVLVIDDGSTDETGSICDEYTMIDCHFASIHTKNQGSAMARNVGLDLVDSEIIAMIDSDDCVNINYLSDMYQTMVETKADIVSHLNQGFVNDEDIDTKEVIQINEEDIQVLSRKQTMARIVNEYRPAYITPFKLYKTSLFYNLRYPNVKKNDDEWIIHQLIDRIDKVAFLNVKNYYYRFNPDSQTRSFSVDVFSDVFALLDRLNLLREKYSNLAEVGERNFFYRVMDVLNQCNSHSIDWNSHYMKIKREMKYIFWRNIKNQRSLYSRRDLLRIGMFVYFPSVYFKNLPRKNGE